MHSSRGSSQPRDQTRVSMSPALAYPLAPMSPDIAKCPRGQNGSQLRPTVLKDSLQEYKDQNKIN